MEIFSPDYLIILFLGLIVLIWLFPILHILFSSKIGGNERLAWLLAVIFISWLAYIFFLLLAPIKKEEKK